MNVCSPASLSDAELLVRVKQLAQSERQATAALVAHLAEVETRRLYLGQGYPSLFGYCTKVLHLSEHAAYNRIEAAKAAVRFPVILIRLAGGDVHLSAVKLLAPLLTPENHRELLDAAKHKSKREIEEIVARLRPQPDAPSSVSKLPSSKVTATPAANPESLFAPGAAPSDPGAGTAPGTAPGVAPDAAPSAAASDRPAPAAAAAPRPATVVPLAPERYKVQFTASAATYQKLRKVQALLRHQIPDGDLAKIMDRALDLLVRELEKKKFAATNRQREENAATDRPRGPNTAADQPRDPNTAADQPRDPNTAAGRTRDPNAAADWPPDRNKARGHSRHIPAAVKRAVWKRDQGRCTFVSPTGKRCDEEGQLEFDHIWPHGDGGGATVENVRLLCARHNQHQAREFFGVWQEEGVRESTAPYDRFAAGIVSSRHESWSGASLVASTGSFRGSG